MNQNLFRKSSIDRVTSPEQLDDYIRVTGPSLWVVLLAMILLLASMLVWGTFGALPTRLSAMGYAQDGTVTCYLTPEDAAKVEIGMEAQAGMTEGEVLAVGAEPLSQREIEVQLGSDYLTAGEWNVPVELSAPGIADGVVQTSITVDSIHPIQFILN